MSGFWRIIAFFIKKYHIKNTKIYLAVIVFSTQSFELLLNSEYYIFFDFYAYKNEKT